MTSVQRHPRIALVSQWWPSQLGAGLLVRMAATLEDLGAVTVVTGVLTAPAGQRNQWWRRSQERMGPYPVFRYANYPGRSSSAVKRIAMYASFAAASTLGAQRILTSADVAVIYSSPATAAAAPMVAERLRGVPYILIVQDVWPDSVFAAGFVDSGLTYRAAKAVLGPFVDASYRNAAHVVVISEGMRDLLMSRGVPPEKLTVIYNWANEDLFPEPISVPKRSAGQPLHLMYAGNAGPPQGLEHVLRAIATLPRDAVRFTVYGGGVDRPHLQSVVDELQLNNVEFHGYVPQERMPELMSTAHLHLVSLIDHPLFEVTIPSKLQLLLAAGAPLLVTAPGEAAAVTQRSGAGIVAAASNPDDIARALRQALDQPDEWFAAAGRAGRDYYFAHMSAAINAQRLRTVVRDVLSDRP